MQPVQSVRVDGPPLGVAVTSSLKQSTEVCPNLGPVLTILLN